MMLDSFVADYRTEIMGSTGSVLHRTLIGLRSLIDRSLAETPSGGRRAGPGAHPGVDLR